MKELLPWMIQLEENDSEQTAIDWLCDHTNFERVQAEDWLNVMQPGDVIIINPQAKTTGVFRLNVDLVEKQVVTCDQSEQE